MRALAGFAPTKQAGTDGEGKRVTTAAKSEYLGDDIRRGGSRGGSGRGRLRFRGEDLFVGLARLFRFEPGEFGFLGRSLLLE